MNYTVFLSIFIAFALPFTTARAQQENEPIRAQTELVTVNVAVLNGKGKFVEGLKSEAFEIFDNQTRQQIAYFSGAEAPVSYGIVYDMHPTTEERTAAVLDSLRAFTKGLGADDRFFVVAFNERGYLNLDFVPTADQLQANLKPAEPRSLYDALYLAGNQLRAGKNLKRVLLVISDTADHRSQHNFADVAKLLKTFDVQVYTVIFDESQMWQYADVTGGKPRRRIDENASPLDRAALQALTLKTGGATNFPTTATSAELFRIYHRVDWEMRRFYSLSFYPADSDGKWHELRIGLDRSVKGGRKFSLTYRPGYQSVVQKP